MNRELEIVEKLVLGIDPLGRGEPLHTPRDAALDKARAIYYEQLKRVCKQHGPAPAVPPAHASRPGESRAGERWSIAEDNRLTALWETSPTVSTASLAEKLGRSPTAIIARLVRLGFFSDLHAAMQADNNRLEALGQAAHWTDRDWQSAAFQSAEPGLEHRPNAGKPWRAEEDQQLQAAWDSAEGPDCTAIATRLGRSRGAIIARLVRIGLLPDRDAVIAAEQQRQHK